jgi:hypothetical protein
VGGLFVLDAWQDDVLWRRRRSLGWFSERACPAAPIAQRVQTPVGSDPVEPGTERGTAFETVEPAPGREQRLLHEVFSVLDGADDPVAVQLQLPAESIDEAAECRLITAARRSASAS